MYSWQSLTNLFELIGLKWPVEICVRSGVVTVMDLIQWKVFWSMNRGLVL